MDSSPLLAYSASNSIYHENVELYQPTNDFLDVVNPVLGENWLIKARGFWARCYPENMDRLEHGWKIHVSSTHENAIETLTIVAKIVSEANVAFKFCADRNMLGMSLNKSSSRFQIGKFIAIYPKDVSEFKEVIQKLDKATRHLAGPYIITDRPYNHSQVVYYRYGVHFGIPRIDPTGRSISGFFLENGAWYEDVRGPSFRLPPGINDPFVEQLSEISKISESSNQQSPKSIVLNKRYLVEGAIKFSATGGIYRGRDTLSGREVVIREVRGKLGHLESEHPEDPAFILKREARILEKLSPTSLVPEYVDLFKEWDHWFLVMEKLDAISLWGRSMEFYFSHEHQSTDFGLDKILSSIDAIATGLQTIHKCGIVLRDLTKNNILFTKGENKIKFIDLEFAYELEQAGPWVRGWTPGYASSEQISSQKPTIKDDCYAFGVLIIDMITFCASGLELRRENIFQKLKLVLSDLGLPEKLYDLVDGLTKLNANERWGIAQARAYLKEIQLSSVETKMFPSRENLLVIDQPSKVIVDRITEVTEGLQKFFDLSMDLSRRDRLWPATIEIFNTNPISLEHGASGVAFFQLRNKGFVSSDVLDWIESREALSLCPPGLYSGLCGVALLLLEAGRVGVAEKLMTKISQDELVNEHPGLYYGRAGWGLTNLHFWLATGNDKYVEKASEIGEWLVKNAKESDEGLYWDTGDKVHLGFGEGQSGIALFLTYLNAATKDEKFLHSAAEALLFEQRYAIRAGGRILWKVHTASHENASNLPHMKFGSAGVGSACIRYYALSGDKRFRDIALDCAYTVRTRMSNKIWQDEGDAGYGEFLLDMALFLDDSRFRDIAFYQAEAILTHAIELPQGIGFGGPDHYRICSDYSYGGAGIGIFFDRLINKKTRFLMLDELLLKSTHE